VNGSFALGDVILSSITLVFHGQSIPALGAGLDVHCCPADSDGERDDDDNGHGDVRALLRGGEHHGDGDDDGENHDLCGVSCPESEDSCEREDHEDAAHLNHPNGHGKGHCEHGNGHGYGHDHHDDDCDEDSTAVTCDTLGIRACFSTQALLQLFAGASLPCDLLGATIHANLANGDTVVATFHAAPPNPNPHPHGDGDDDGQGEDHQGDGDHRGLQSAKVQPNPLNPSTVLSFTTSREGTVRVTVYDMQGRLVKTLLNEYRPAGAQTIAWDGSSNARTHVASGVYFLRIESAEGGVVRRVAVVK